MSKTSPRSLNKDIIECKQCSRLMKYCNRIANEKRKAYENWEYWGRPVPNFGDPKAEFLIVGLAPAAHGANRTGRMFTGDRSGEWLYRALCKSSFANKPNSEHAKDGLILKNTLITSVIHCAPPDNKPTREEIFNCRRYLEQTFEETPFRVVLALGGVAWKSVVKELKRMDILNERQGENEKKFIHGDEVLLKGNRLLLASYHPSQQNTFTGRLTEEMFDRVFLRAQKFLEK